jgi:hypothetical protein
MSLPTYASCRWSQRDAGRYRESPNITVRSVTQNEPLTDAEFDRPVDFLKSCKGGRAMSVEQPHRFFAALIAGPDTVMPCPCGSGKKYKRCWGGAKVN